MVESLHTLAGDAITALNNIEKLQALRSLECGQVVYLPQYTFKPKLEEQHLLSAAVLDSKCKNISYDAPKKRLAGVAADYADKRVATQEFIHRFSLFAKNLIDTLFPSYTNSLIWGRTSYRPAEIKGRASSKRQDDTRLHVDSFPATPVNGLRILRIFSNINPYGEPRVWNLGEPFADVLSQFAPRIPNYNPFQARLLRLIKATKSLRSAYDHYMLHLHDSMKLDDRYQAKVTKHRIDFPAHSTWIVFTDHVSHAALSGQFLLEQTFYLPVHAMDNPDLSPLRHWEKEKSRILAVA